MRDWDGIEEFVAVATTGSFQRAAAMLRLSTSHVSRAVQRLEARIDDWQGVEPHSSFTGRLRESFGQKWSFWQLIER